MIELPSEDKRNEDLHATMDAMWSAVVDLRASYDSICYAAATIIAHTIMSAGRDQGVSQEDVLAAVEKYIKDVLTMNGAFRQ